MPSIIHEGERYIQVRHAMKCLLCGEIVESKSIHDFKSCKCGKVSVDGGILAGNSVLGNPCDMEDYSKWRTECGKCLSEDIINQRHEQIKSSYNVRHFNAIIVE